MSIQPIQSSFFTMHERKIQVLGEMCYSEERNRLIYMYLKKIRHDRFSSETRTAAENVLCSNQGRGKIQTMYIRDLEGKATFLGGGQQWGFQSYFLTDLLICLWHVALRSNLRSHNLFPLSKTVLFRESRCFLNETVCWSGRIETSASDAVGFSSGCSWAVFL